MPINALLALAAIGAALVVLATIQIRPYLVLSAALGVLLLANVVSTEAALSGFANEGLITIALLLVVAAGVRETGAVNTLVHRMLGSHRTSVSVVQLRLMAPVAAASSVLNNTPLVAVLLPVVRDWARRNTVAVSRLMIPLSFASILGGTCSLIGTSPNLVVHGMLLARGDNTLQVFDLAWVGIPCTAVGIGLIVSLGRWLLPERVPPVTRLANPKEYTLEMIVAANGPLVGKTVEEAGLRHLQAVYLVEIDRAGEVLPAVGPGERLHAGDRLVFTGIVDSIVDLQRIPGLEPATDQAFKLDTPAHQRVLVEAVVSDVCPLLGRTIREGRFRRRYGAAVVAVARNGERIRKKVGDIVLQPGDTLLLEAHPEFTEQHRNSRDFYLVSRLDVDGAGPTRPKWQAYVAGGILALVVALAGSGLTSMLQAAFVGAALMLLTRCLNEEGLLRTLDWRLLLAIGAALGLGRALSDSGAAAWIASGVGELSAGNALLALIALYLVTMICTEMVTNTAAVALTFPIAVSVADTLGVSLLPFAVAIMIAGSASFLTPIGYQTNLMVYGPGGYTMRDFLRAGLPVSLAVAIVALTIIPLIWPLTG